MTSTKYTAPHLKQFHFQKGVSGNAAGRPKSFLTKPEVEQLFQALHKKSPAELKQTLDSGKLTILEAMIISVMLKTVDLGDATRLQYLLDRAIGRMPVPQPTDEQTLVMEEIQALSDQELLALVRSKLPQLEEKKPE